MKPHRVNHGQPKTPDQQDEEEQQGLGAQAPGRPGHGPEGRQWVRWGVGLAGEVTRAVSLRGRTRPQGALLSRGTPVSVR